MEATIVSVHTGKPQKLPGSDRLSAIGKVPAEGTAEARKLGLIGDTQIETKYHGGPFKAICVYPREYYPEWIEFTGNDMPFGSFGENFSTQGLLENDACLGDVWAAGSATFCVTGPRVPCGTLAAWWRTPGFQGHVRKTHQTGFYMSVEQEGEVAPGAKLVLQKRPYPHWTIKQVWSKVDLKQAMTEELEELLTIESLDEDWKQRARALLKNPKQETH